MAQQPVRHLGRRPDHPLPHAGQEDRDALPLRRIGALPALDVDVVVLAGEADLPAQVGVLRDQADDLDALLDVRRRLAVGHPVPALVQPLEPGAQAEDEAAAGEHVHVQRR